MVLLVGKTIAEVAEVALRKAQKPLHYKEITKQVLQQCKLRGPTPHYSVRSRLGTNGRFKRVGEGIYALAKWQGYEEIRFGKDIAYDILRSHGREMSLKALGNEILKKRFFVGVPSAVALNSIKNDTQFEYDSTERTVGLAEWGEESNS